jgi:hypothetical protein
MTESSIPFWLTCTRCAWQRALVPTAPATHENRAADWRAARRRAEYLACPDCGDVNVVAVERNAYGHVIRESV